ncbi:hypothetical protein NL108_010197 [Boleophthalmus pectinirostris]|nr:hypothetical protein NL108_010197 [Boleophthalmus pectinirostris]
MLFCQPAESRSPSSSSSASPVQSPGFQPPRSPRPPSADSLAPPVDQEQRGGAHHVSPSQKTLCPLNGTFKCFFLYEKQTHLPLADQRMCGSPPQPLSSAPQETSVEFWAHEDHPLVGLWLLVNLWDANRLSCDQRTHASCPRCAKSVPVAIMCQQPSQQHGLGLCQSWS